MAVAGIDATKLVFKQPSTYTLLLSGLIKIGQLLAIQQVVMAVDEGEIQYASDMLDGMRERFLISESRSPLGWAIWLRG